MKHTLSAILQQKQTISPQQAQSLRILQMGHAHLMMYLRDAAMENPLLELDDAHSDELCWDALRDSDAPAQPLTETVEPRDPVETVESSGHPASQEGWTLADYLQSQFHPALCDADVRLLQRIIDALDARGYLTMSVAELAQSTGLDAEAVEEGVGYLQTLEPYGVCARDLGECLCIQLWRLGYTDPLLPELAKHHLEDIAAGRFHKIGAQLRISSAQTRALAAVLQRLNPKPAAGFGVERIQPVFPDVRVTLEQGTPRAELTRQDAPVSLNDYYLRMARQDAHGEATDYLKTKLAQAQWVLDAIAQRAKTLDAIAACIANRQADFFLGGALLPLTLEHAARDVGLHESTVSRAIQGKYLLCDCGLFPLKHFFAASASQTEGAPVSRNSVRDAVQRIIQAEDKRAPLSDARMAELLAAQGFVASRRVIAKYRGELGIPGTSARKQG